MSPEKRGGIQPEKPRKKTGFKEVALGLVLAAGLGAATESGKLGVKKVSAEDGDKDEVAEKKFAENKLGKNLEWQGSKYTVEPSGSETQQNEPKEKLAIPDDVFEKTRELLEEKGFELEPREDKDGKIICDLYNASDPETGEKKVIAEVLIEKNGTMQLGRINEYDKAVTVADPNELFKNLEKKFWFDNEVGIYRNGGSLDKLQKYVAENKLDVQIPRSGELKIDQEVSQEDLKKMRDKMFESDVGDSNKNN